MAHIIGKFGFVDSSLIFLLSENGRLLDAVFVRSKLPDLPCLVSRNSLQNLRPEKVRLIIMGYSGVNTIEQKPEFQVDALEKAEAEEIFWERFTRF